MSCLRHVRFWLALVMLPVLVACGTSLENEGKASRLLGSPTGEGAPPIAVTEVTGIPQDKLDILFASLIKSAQRRDIELVPANTAGAWKLSGRFVPEPDGYGNTVLKYHWQLKDVAGRTVHRVAGKEKAGTDGLDPWHFVKEAGLQRIAGHTAESLSSQLSVYGFATRAAGVPPPMHALQKASANAEKELDYETLLGPGRTRSSAPALAEILGGEPEATDITALATDDLEREDPISAPHVPLRQDKSADIATASPKPVQQQEATGKGTIDAVAVTQVRGSPGPGNRQLADALRAVLRQAGWPVHDQHRANALIITGDVSLTEPVDGRQQVALAWQVALPTGKVLGTVKQQNSIPAGSLNKGWGRDAAAVSKAAADGIFDLIQKAQNGG